MAQAGFEELFARASRVDDAELFYRDLLGLVGPVGRAMPEQERAEDQPDPTTPSGLHLAPHSHVRRTCSGSTFTSAGSATAMSPSTMDPGFFTSSGALQFDHALDRRLIDLMVDHADYRKFLHADSIRRRWPSDGDRIRVALVDLTGPAKLCRPGYAGWGSTQPMRGSSTAKIAIIYAAHQVVFDLDRMAKAQGCTTAAQLEAFALGTAWSSLTCKPKIRELVDIDASVSPVRVTMKSSLSTSLDQIVFGSDGNRHASNTLLRLGFEYVGSLLWQSGLRHPDRKGLWMHNTYAVGTEASLFDRACHSGSNPVVWKDDPLREGGIMLTALSVATFFTLLAQRRLADDATSTAMERLLARGCVMFGAVRDALPSNAVRAAKCGTASGFVHDAVLVEHGKFRYVMVYLTKDLPMSVDLRKQFVRDLDGLIRSNNP